jgi:hypothetical protein
MRVWHDPEAMTREERREFLKILEAHAQTIAICEACAVTTRDLAAEVKRGGAPPPADLGHTIATAEQVLSDLAGVREEVERLMTAFR